MLIRKVSYGNKSEKGAENHKIMATVMEACRMHGVDFCEYLRDALAGRANIALLTAAM